MKKLWLPMVIATILVIACSATANVNQFLTAPTPTETQIVLPILNATPPLPTPTPIVLSPTPTQLPTPTPIPDTYTVQTGDTIISIANRFGLDFGYLADQNGITNPNLIFVGQVLKIPVWPPKDDGKEIYVVLSQQKVYAMENGVILKTFVVSTGIAKYPTITGHFQIYVKYRYTDMSGPGYYLPNVPYTMYFFQGYGLHGTYWHHNFGTPMSHGCVNLYTPDAEWLFNWAKVGTPVIVVP